MSQEAEKLDIPLTPPEAPDDHVYPTGAKLTLLMISLYIAMFLVALVVSPRTSSPVQPANHHML